MENKGKKENTYRKAVENKRMSKSRRSNILLPGFSKNNFQTGKRRY
jgi:hypothetical protein